jgi:hypothetical protein
VRQAGSGNSGTAAERELVRVMLTSRSLIERIAERVGPGEFRDERYREIFDRLILVSPDAVIGDVAAGLSAPALSVLESMLEQQGAIIDVEKTLTDCLAQLELRKKKAEQKQLQADLKVATEAEKDRLIRRKEDIAEEIKSLTEGMAGFNSTHSKSEVG